MVCFILFYIIMNIVMLTCQPIVHFNIYVFPNTPKYIRAYSMTKNS